MEPANLNRPRFIRIHNGIRCVATAPAMGRSGRQLCVIVVVHWLLRIQLPIWSLLSLVGFTAATNAAYSFWLDVVRRRKMNRDNPFATYHLVACLMLVDLLTLTGMLWFSGSLQNPFALFYFVNIAVAGVILTPVWAWSLWAGAVACVILLLMVGEPLASLQKQHLAQCAFAMVDRLDWIAHRLRNMRWCDHLLHHDAHR